MSGSPKSVLVLAGGPDAEREVSLMSATNVAQSLREGGEFTINYQEIGRVSADELRGLPGDVIFPVLHGHFGEGGPLQDLLEADGRPYVGCGPRAARLAMDKVATKLAAARLGIPTADLSIFNPLDAVCPFDPPVVLKPVHEGSSVGLHICRAGEQWARAHAAASADMREHPGRVYLIERGLLGGRELTVGVFDGAALPVIEIRPAEGVYDYQAKYFRDDTAYICAPELPVGLTERIQAQASALARSLGVRHLARADFILDETGTAWLLEVNTMPGFTGHSLFPMAARYAGIETPRLCAMLVRAAWRDRSAGA
ncbi:MAG: D-alanine--D-alanine ligase [Phycisphaerales bacterium]|nr:D-alanine--D-alanine ligase [Phycisphaerales bacterium]